MKWMIKSRTNLISLRFVFVLSPMLVSFGSFFTYVYLGNKLDVATAFINRIAAYLDEDEVSGQVSSLKRDATASRVAEDEQGDLGFENASFKWNEIEKKDEDKKKKKEAKRPIWRRLPRFRRSRSSSPSGASETTAAVEAPEQPEHRFELRDLNVKFPQGVLTVVTGPTASGKTALLVSCLILRANHLHVLTKLW
jgi:ABC-type multidrug transport system fused ATPase/permease subunit